MTTSKETKRPIEPTAPCPVHGTYAWRWWQSEGKWACSFCQYLNRLKEQLEINCLDPELYDVLADLNSRGYFTHSSCAGHRKGSRGSIDFCQQDIKGSDREHILWILQKHRLKDIELEGGHASFAAIEGSQYGNGINDMWPPWEDADYGNDIPPKPDKCPTCGGSGFWIQGEFYDISTTLEWMCKNCQPLPFGTTCSRSCLTPEIVKRRAELPELKLWEVEDYGNTFPFRIRAKNERDVYDQLGLDPYSDDDHLYIKRLE